MIYDLTTAVEQGTIDDLRAIFNNRFWAGRKHGPEVTWKHLQAATQRGDKAMLRLLCLWSEPLTLTAMQVATWEPDQYPDYIKILRANGMTIKDLTAQEKKLLSLKPGDVADDGSGYLGYYKNFDWYVADKRLYYIDESTFCLHDASNEAAKIEIHGHKNWQIPDPEILTLMFKHSGHRVIMPHISYYNRNEMSADYSFYCTTKDDEGCVPFTTSYGAKYEDYKYEDSPYYPYGGHAPPSLRKCRFLVCLVRAVPRKTAPAHQKLRKPELQLKNKG